MKIIKREDVLSTKLKVLVYGRPGTAKTRTVGSAAMCTATAPALMITLGGNPISLRDFEKMPTVLELESLADFNVVYDFFAGGQSEKHPLGQSLGVKPGGEFKCLIVDGASYVQHKVGNMLSKWGGDFDTKPTDTDPSFYKGNVDWWNEWAGKFFGLADKHARLPVHVLVTALEREPAVDYRSTEARAKGVKGPSPNAMIYRPLFFGQASTIVEGYALIVARMISLERVDVIDIVQINKNLKEEGVQVSRTDHWNMAMFVQGPDYVAKDQFLRLPAYLPDPTMAQICEYVYGK